MTYSLPATTRLDAAIHINRRTPHVTVNCLNGCTACEPTDVRTDTAALATQDAGSLPVRFVKGRDGDVGQVQCPRKADLARAGPPCLSQRSGWDVDGQAGRVRFVEQSLHPPIGPLDGNQGSS